MTVEMITDFDAVTGESITRPATEEELEQKIYLQAEAEAEAEAAAAKAEAKAAVLDRLGLSAEEAKLLLA
jgi:hypothetical protein